MRRLASCLLGSWKREDMVNRKAQQRASHNNQPNPYRANLEPLADGCEQQDRCQHHGFSHVVVGAMARQIALLKGVCGLPSQPGCLFRLGAAIFRHVEGPWRSIRVVERIGLLPGLKRRTKLRKETTLRQDDNG